MLPYRASASERGIGVAVNESTSASVPFPIRVRRWFTPKRCCSSMTTRLQSAGTTSGSSNAWVPNSAQSQRFPSQTLTGGEMLTVFRGGCIRGFLAERVTQNLHCEYLTGGSADGPHSSHRSAPKARDEGVASNNLPGLKIEYGNGISHTSIVAHPFGFLVPLCAHPRVLQS